MACCKDGPCRMIFGSTSTKKEELAVTAKGVNSCVLVNAQGRRWEEAYEAESEILGEGGFGTVRKAKQIHGGRIVVMKSMLKEGIPDMALFQSEISVQAELDHPHIVKLYETFEDIKVIYLMMETCDGGQALDIIEASENGVSELDAWHMTTQLLSALAYMHEERHIVHRDLKPENFLVKEKGARLADCHLKLIDFGFARHFEPGQTTMTTKCGTPYYMAPEIMEGPYNEKCDIWSSGCILFLFLSGAPPFDDPSGECDDILKVAKEGRLDFSSSAWQTKSVLARSLLRLMIHKQPNHRPSAISILKDNDWIKQERKEVIQSSEQLGECESAEDIRTGLMDFQAMDSFKKKALTTVAHLMDDADIAKITRTFEKMDTDGTGVITLEEVTTACVESGIKADDVAKLVKSVDKHGDGTLDYTEFISSQLASQSGDYLKECYCWEAFRIFDKDGDGTIEMNELELMLMEDSNGCLEKAGVSVDKSEVKALMKEFDTNQDGVIDFDEFMAMMRKQSQKSSS